MMYGVLLCNKIASQSFILNIILMSKGFTLGKFAYKTLKNVVWTLRKNCPWGKINKNHIHVHPIQECEILTCSFFLCKSLGYPRKGSVGRNGRSHLQ
jgi:hypothetical protein